MQVLADPSQDMWAFGVVLYHMAAKCSLFNCDYAGNVVSENDLRDLAFWSEDVKWDRMSMIPDKYARNLISQLLMKDPLKRPNIQQVLSHPFMTGRTATRLDGTVLVIYVARVLSHVSFYPPVFVTV